LASDDQHEVPPGALGRFAAGRASATEQRLIGRHLLARCPVCRAGLRARSWSLGHARERAPGAYDAVFARCLRRTTETAEREHRRAVVARLLKALDAVALHEREMKARNVRRFASLDLSAALVERSHAARYRDPDTMLRDGRLAVATAEAAAARRVAEEEVLRDSCARAWAALGNAHRVMGKLREANQAFDTAFKNLEAGTGNANTRGLLCRQLAFVRIFEREFRTAECLAEEAATVFRGVEDRVGEAGGLITLGIVRIYSGDPESAIEPLLCAEALAESCNDDELWRAAAHNLIWAFRDSGRPRQAANLALRAEAYFVGSDDKLVLRRMEWQRGLIDRDLGRLDMAERRLTMVRDAFAAADLCYEVGVVSLDLASVYLLDGRPIAALKILGEAIPLFQSLGIKRELLFALGQVSSCVRERDMALALLRVISKQLAPGIPRDGG
jgi:tetratricopeptide (TPR) repeat protein